MPVGVSDVPFDTDDIDDEGIDVMLKNLKFNYKNLIKNSNYLNPNNLIINSNYLNPNNLNLYKKENGTLFIPIVRKGNSDI